ncbi:hypothetical protein BpHYR1_026794 [Brachionus plicatilis]|uniref:Uncharacterized protein n=1 Tax=Brachionus plicatilis TaxID=10195 RepID=A0A3M7PP61_BRAPC|nr:hypothetical protein BpHYR1_026794 [Brachionus plicatilis]
MQKRPNPHQNLENSVFTFGKLNIENSFLKDIIFLLNLDSVDLGEVEIEEDDHIDENYSKNFNFSFFVDKFCDGLKRNNKNIKNIPILNESIKLRYEIFEKCDKNVGTLLISNEDFLQLAYEHLDNTETYLKLESDPLLDIEKKINFELKYLYDKSYLSKRLYNKLLDFTKNS